MKNYYDLLTDENKKIFLELENKDKINIVQKFYEMKDNKTNNNQDFDKDKDEDVNNDFQQRKRVFLINIIKL